MFLSEYMFTSHADTPIIGDKRDQLTV